MLRFKCRTCGNSGTSYAGRNADLPHYPWYSDPQGLQHGCLYCRSCGTIHDTVGSLAGVVKMLCGRVPSKVVAVYDLPAFTILLRISNPDFITLGGLPPLILSALEEDGRLPDDEELEAQPSVAFLRACLGDPNPNVRREAQTALQQLGAM